MVSSVLGLLLEGVKTLFGGVPLVEAAVVVPWIVLVVETLIWPNGMGMMTEKLTPGHLHGYLPDMWQTPLRPMLNMEVGLRDKGILIVSPMPRILHTKTLWITCYLLLVPRILTHTLLLTIPMAP